MKDQSISDISKRLTAFFLASAMALALCVFNKATVYAAGEIALSMDINRSMSVGTTNPTPKDYDTPTNDQIFINWDFSLPSQTYELTYPIENNKVVVFYVTRDAQTAQVDYVVYDGDPYNGGVIDVSNTYSIHTNEGANGLAKYVKYSEYIAKYNGATPQTYQVNSVPEYPSFTISPGLGYSFIYGNQTIHFRWNIDSNGNNAFYYVTNGLKQGFVYDFSLYNYTNGTSRGTGNTKRLLTGLDQSKITCVQTADSPNADYSLKQSDTVYDPDPGTNPGMIVSFNLPMKWNPATNEFDSYIDDSDPMMHLVFTFNNRDAGKAMQYVFPTVNMALDASGIYPTSSYSFTKGSSYTGAVNAGVKRTGSTVTLYMEGIEPSLLFYPSSIFVPQTNDFVTRDTVPDINVLYTFLDYKIVAINNVYYALVQPYKGYAGYYMLKENGRQAVIQQTSDGMTPLLMPLSISDSNNQERILQLFFSPTVPFINEDTTSSLKSQKLTFSANPKNLTVGVPHNFDVVDYRLIPRAGAINGEADLEMTLSWDIGLKTIIDKLIDLPTASDPIKALEVIYNLQNSLQPYDDSPNIFAAVKVTLIAEYVITPGSADKIVYSVVYNDAAGADAKGTGKVLNTDPVLLDAYLDSETKSLKYVAAVKISVPSSPKGPAISVDFFYPDIYFVSVNPVKVNGTPINITASLSKSVTLNDLSKLSVPPPQNVQAAEPKTTSTPAYTQDEVSFKAKWNFPGGQIMQYLESSYNLPPEAADIVMNLYISQSPDKLDAFSKISPEERVNNSVTVNPPQSGPLYFSSINGNPALSAGSYSNPREALRNGEIVRVGGFALDPQQFADFVAYGFSYDFNVVIDGLDKNQKYYIRVDTVVNHRDADLTVAPPVYFDLSPKIINYSILSNIAGITTMSDIVTPDPADVIPPKPVLDKEDIAQNQAVVFWSAINPTPSSSLGSNVVETIEYEIIRISDKQMDTVTMQTRNKLEYYYPSGIPSGAGAIALRTDGTKLFKFNGGSSFEETAKEKFELLNGKIYKLTDKTLSPNKLYFYYVRTVKKTTDGTSTTEIYSYWADISVTTEPVRAPINLTIDRTSENLDRQHEIIFHFGAAIGSITNLNDNGVKLQYQIKQDGGSWSQPITMDSAKLAGSAVLGVGTYKDVYFFSYKLMGLTPGATYYLQVRMLDSNGDASAYSNMAQFRTEFNQDEYDFNKTMDDWIKYLSSQLDKLIKQPYWTASSSNKQFKAVYRPDMLAQLIKQSVDTNVVLEGSHSAEAIYYIPASALSAANSANKGFNIKFGDINLIIPANAVTSYNSAMYEISQRISSKNITDYYLRITVKNTGGAVSVNGSNSIGYAYEMKFELVGTNKKITDWDNSIVGLLLTETAAAASGKKMRDKLTAMLKSNSYDQDLVNYIASQVDATSANFIKTVNTQIDKEINSTYSVTSFDKPVWMLLRTVPANTTVNGYRFTGGNWVSCEMVNMLGGKALSASYPGLYAFTGKAASLNQMIGMPDSGFAGDMFSKYGLTDFIPATFKLTDNISRQDLLGVIARIAGAPKGSDAVDWLNKNQGLKFSSRNPEKPMSTQEAIYAIMGLYEAKSKVKVANIKIRNFNKTAGITGIEDMYLQSIRAAFELGIIDDDSMKPNDSVNVGKLIDMLANVNKLVKL